MPEAEDATERRVKNLRYGARGLALVWAGFRSLVVISYCLYRLTFRGGADVILWPVLTLLLLIPWVSVAIAWRWEFVGGVLLALEGLISIGIPIIVTLVTVGQTWWEIEILHEYVDPVVFVGVVFLLSFVFAGIMAAVPPLVGSILFLITWRESRRPRPAQKSQ